MYVFWTFSPSSVSLQMSKVYIVVSILPLFKRTIATYLRFELYNNEAYMNYKLL